MHFYLHNRGFTAYFAILVSALALSIGLSIYDLLIREISLSEIARESQYAIFAADTGAECALYWDNKGPVLNGVTSVFGTSSASTWGNSSINCNNESIIVQGPPTIDWSQYVNTGYNCPSSPTSAWCIASSANAATTTFRIDFTLASPAVNYCATVIVAKWGNPSQTTITSHGYNNCGTAGVANGAVRLERALQVSY